MYSKVYSDIIPNGVFDTEEACLEAEAKYQKEQEEKKAQLATKESSISKQKKELSKAIEDADAKLTEAYDHLTSVKREADEAILKARREAHERIKEAEDLVTEAYQQKYQAISQFNEKFGDFTMRYTGRRANEEFKRIMEQFDNYFKKPVDFWFF